MYQLMKYYIYFKVSGIPLRGKKRIQFNMFLKNISSIKLTENLTTILMPILWVEEVRIAIGRKKQQSS